MGCSYGIKRLLCVICTAAVVLIFIPVCILPSNYLTSNSDLLKYGNELLKHHHYSLVYSNNTSVDFSHYPLLKRSWIPVTKSFHFHPGKDSVGGDLDLMEKQLLIPAPAAVQELQELCVNTENCVGFTTDGILKRTLLPYNNWSALTTTNKGLYVLNVDFCGLGGGHICPKGKSCVNESNGRYSCEAPVTPAATTPAATTSTLVEQEEVPMAAHATEQDTIHLVLSVDKLLLKGLVAVLESLKEHNARNNIQVYIVVGSGDRIEVESKVVCSVRMTERIKISYLNFDLPKSFQQLITVQKHTYLASTSNFARFYFDKLFPSLSHILYLDVDTIVQHDISELWREVVSSDRLLVAASRKFPDYKIHFPNKNFTTLFQKRYGKEVNMSGPTFNAGVIGFNLDKWRKSNVTEDVIYWMRENMNDPLWFQGTQPILYIVGYNDWTKVDRRWNVEGLGWTKVPPVLVKTAYILHWNGPNKPFGQVPADIISKHTRRNRRTSPHYLTGQYNYVWKKYSREVCSDRGTCELGDVKGGKDSGNGITAAAFAVCKCKPGFKGQICEKHAPS